MAVIVLIGEAKIFECNIKDYFKDKCEVIIPKGEFPSIRSFMSNQSSDKLYILTDLGKPERYEIYCLSRKNEQRFISICLPSKNGLATSDKNVIIMDKFDGIVLNNELERSQLLKTSATKRSKGLSMKGLSGIKEMINSVNKEYINKYKNVEFILTECEDRVIRLSNLQYSMPIEAFEKCYRKMIKDELESKGIL